MTQRALGMAGLAAIVFGVVAASSIATGCASERDPINRVQLNAVPKSFLVGSDYTNPADDPEFYARSMVINVPYGESGSSALMFTNTINSMAKIKWQIQSDKLIGRVSFERIDGTDGQGTDGSAGANGGGGEPPSNPERDVSKPLSQNNGVVVYVFPIEKQFDIRRAYNAQTGEESNIVEENENDRAWVDRDYIRVNFAKNLVTTAYDFDTLSLLGIINGITYSPIDYAVQNPGDPDAPTFDLDNGYFDVTNKLFAEPKMIDLGGGQMIPGCMLPNVIGGGTEPAGNCNPNELTIRHSFKRVVDSDYEPTDWDGQRFETYGAFTTQRQGYSRDYGLVDSKWKRHISRYNIWERSHHYADPAAMTGATTCKVTTDCFAVGDVPGMSHCDSFSEKCTLPYKDRVAKPVIWHYADTSPAEYYEATREAAEEWDTAMRGAVIAAKYAECKRFVPTDACGAIISGNFAEEEDALYLVKEVNACRRGEAGRPVDQCDALADEIAAARGYAPAVVELAKAKPMVVLCHGPVSDKDPAECGKPGTVARLGDLRYHLITSVATPQTNSPWGIMSDSNDPVTGEHVAASVNVWTNVNDLFSRGLVDTLRYIGGELKTEDVTDGRYVDRWVEAARSTRSGGAPIMGAAEIDKRIAAAAGTTVEKMARAHAASSAGFARGGPGSEASKINAALRGQLDRVAQTRAAFDAPSLNAPTYQARMNLAKGTPLESQVATPAMQQLAQSGYGLVGPDAKTKLASTSLFQGLDPALRRGLETRRELSLAARGACIMSYEATAPIGYVALGNVLQAKFGEFNPSDPPEVQAARADKMKDYVRRRVQYAIIAHEMGHSFGLRHNFVSSSDAWNFRPQYWQLRTNDKKLSGTRCKEDGSSEGKSCVGPRWLDPVSDNEAKHMLTMWAQSSAMEYPGEPSQELLGIGAYDFGAVRMFYGDVATVYASARFKRASTAGTLAELHQNDFGGLRGFRYGDLSHYSELDGAVDLIEKCAPVDPAAFKPAQWNEAKDGIWSPIVDGHIVENEQGTPTRCTQPQVDFVQWDQLENTESKTHAHVSSKATRLAGQARVPHGFASDEWADLGNVSVFRHDNGADLYETMHFWIAQEEMNHIFTNYRRGRRDFSIWGAFQRTMSRYHEKMRDAAKAIGLYITIARDTVVQYNTGGNPQGYIADILKGNAAANTVASSIAFDYFGHVFARPQPGEHAKLGSGDAVLRSVDGTGFAERGHVILSVSNGVTGGFGNISLGGRPIENQLARDKGRDYDRDFTLNVGSYYEKAFTAMLLTESADNFISASRADFVDARFRAVSLADVFPEGFRRWLGNNLTDDESIKGVYVRGSGTGTGPRPPALDADGYALLGATSWWPIQGIETCFPDGERLSCRDPFATTPLSEGGAGPVIDPQVGWEQQKFAIVQSLIYLPENQRTNWLDQMTILQLGVNSDPGFENRIEFHDPDGKVYVAQTFGTEVLYGKTVQRGIAARILEYANELLQAAVVTEPIKKGEITIGYTPVLDADGKVQYLQGGAPASSCAESKECLKMKDYTAVPKLLREAMDWLGWTRHASDLKGVY
ncbi:MAG: hypothetical protein JWP87_4755 [Labilithrix sp.]|nr:hypothetical protein [Labilithrix sp.]